MTPHPPLGALCNKDYYDKCFASSPALARQFLIHLASDPENSHSIASIARSCGITRPTVYKALKRNKQGLSLDNLSTRPKSYPKQIPVELEKQIVELRKETNFGCLRVSCELRIRHDTQIHYNTVARVFKRNGLKKRKRIKTANSELRDYYLAPLRFWEIDTKEITDLHALPREVYDHVSKYNLPVYQYTAIDTFTRLRMLSYAYHNNFENGWAFIQYVIQCNRLAGNHGELVIQTDNGMEYGGFYPDKLVELNKELKILDASSTGNSSTLIHIPKMQKQKQGHVERSHRTDDEELYIPHLNKAKNNQEFLELTQKWLWYYNTQRPHQGKYIKLQSPLSYAKQLQTIGFSHVDKNTENTENTENETKYLAKEVNLDNLKNVPVLLLDSISTQLIMFIAKLKGEAGKSRKSVNDVCVEYQSHPCEVTNTT
jgi:transposase